MSSKILYSSPEKQIEKLKTQNLIIKDESQAVKFLELYGYTNLIKNYRRPYTISTSNGIIYRSGVTFDQVCSLYLLDKNLRNAVIAAMLDLEEHIKEATADVLARSFGTDHNDYLKFRNYQNKKVRIQRFSLAAILDSITKTLSSDQDPVHHYISTYGTVPPWVLLKVQFMGTIVNLIDKLKQPQQEMLFTKLYPHLSNSSINKDYLQMMRDTLFICYEYRNIAAHGGRIYNHKCKAHFRQIPELKISPSGFSQLLQLLSLMDYKNPWNYLNLILNSELNRHCSRYPEDVTYLSSTLNMNIQLRKIVWISGSSKKYHVNRHCSGILHPEEMNLEEAVAKGYRPCKRCCE